jgi:hypothetical protein
MRNLVLHAIRTCVCSMNGSWTLRWVSGGEPSLLQWSRNLRLIQGLLVQGYTGDCSMGGTQRWRWEGFKGYVSPTSWMMLGRSQLLWCKLFAICRCCSNLKPWSAGELARDIPLENLSNDGSGECSRHASCGKYSFHGFQAMELLHIKCKSSFSK